MDIKQCARCKDNQELETYRDTMGSWVIVCHSCADVGGCNYAFHKTATSVIKAWNDEQDFLQDKFEAMALDGVICRRSDV